MTELEQRRPLTRTPQRDLTEEVPKALENLVERSNAGFSFRHPGSDMSHDRVIGGFLVSALAVLAVGVAVSAALLATIVDGAAAGAATFLISGLLAAVGLGLTWGLMALGFGAADRSRVTVEPGGVRESGLFGTRMDRPNGVTLRGEIGRPIEIRVDDHVLISRVPDAIWTYPALLCLAEQTASTLDAPLHDDLPHPAWRRWHIDSAYQAAVRFARKHQDNVVDFQDWHRVAAAEAEDLQTDLDGLRSPHLQLRNGRLLDRRFTMELADVRAASMNFWPVPGTELFTEDESYGAVLVLLDDAICRVGVRRIRTPVDVAHLRAETKLVRDYAIRARKPDAGGWEDLPEELATLWRDR